MPIDARISMGLRPQTYDAFAAYDTGRQNEQTFRTNQMAMQRRLDAQAALNAMRQQVPPTMQPGGVGPAITGGPLPSVNAMGASAPMPAAVVAPAAPVNAARDMSPLYQFMDVPEIKNYVDEMNRQETARATAADRATDNTRQQDAADIQRGQYTQGLLQQGAVNLLDDQSDEAILRNAAQLAAMPGADVPMINANRDALLALEPPARAIAVRRAAAIDTGASRAAGLTEPNLVPRTDGASSWFEDMNRNSPTFGQRFSVTAMQETPGQRRGGQNREEDRQNRLADDQARLDADAEAAQAEADALEASRADADDIAAAQGRAAAAAAAAAANRRLRDGPAPRPAPTAPAAGSGLPPVGPEGQRVRNRNTNRIFVSRGGRWVPE